MVNAEEIFKISMALADSLGEDGSADIGDNTEYRARCLPIMNSLIPELYPFSMNFYSSEADSRPEPPELKSFSDAVPLDAAIARGVLPQGLAAALMRGEDPGLADFLQGRYERLKAELKRGIRCGSEEIEDVYGGMGGINFGRW